jgi:hypothetical protein
MLLAHMLNTSTASAVESMPIPRTLGDVREMLMQADGTDRTKLQISAINTVARALGCGHERWAPR